MEVTCEAGLRMWLFFGFTRSMNDIKIYILAITSLAFFMSILIYMDDGLYPPCRILVKFIRDQKIQKIESVREAVRKTVDNVLGVIK